MQEEWYSTINVAIRKKNFKLRHRWYMTPLRMHKMFPEVGDHCWRCKKKMEDLKYIWWACEKLQEFWKRIHGEITIKLKIPPPFLTFVFSTICIHSVY